MCAYLPHINLFTPLKSIFRNYTPLPCCSEILNYPIKFLIMLLINVYKLEINCFTYKAEPGNTFFDRKIQNLKSQMFEDQVPI